MYKDGCMHRKIMLLSLFLFDIMYGMELSQITNQDLRAAIFDYAPLDESGRIQVDIDFILRHAICEKYNPKCIRAIFDLGDTDIINKVTVQQENPHDSKSRFIFVTPLYLAVMHDNVDAVKLLLDCPLTNINKHVPLYRAVLNENVEIVKLFLAHPKIQINAVDAYGETALFAAAVIPKYDRLYKNRLSCIVALLLQAGIDSAIVNNDDETAPELEYNLTIMCPVELFKRPVDPFDSFDQHQLMAYPHEYLSKKNNL